MTSQDMPARQLAVAALDAVLYSTVVCGEPILNHVTNLVACEIVEYSLQDIRNAAMWAIANCGNAEMYPANSIAAGRNAIYIKDDGTCDPEYQWRRITSEEMEISKLSNSWLTYLIAAGLAKILRVGTGTASLDLDANR